MTTTSHILTQVPDDEKGLFATLIKKRRDETIRTSAAIVSEVFSDGATYEEQILSGKISKTISDLREACWQSFLVDEAKFNVIMTKELHETLSTPAQILDNLVSLKLEDINTENLSIRLREACGEYAGLIYPYVYQLSLSNTQSRRSRAGATFEAIIYKIYDLLGYEYDSQKKVGRKTFQDVGLGKKVDSILPGVAQFKKRRNKTIIGTMKTSLRERWQEVAEEIERTKIPEIHLLTADENISLSKLKEMSHHNIVVVAYDVVANNDNLKQQKNIISFEEYLLEELPGVINYWSDE